MGSVARALLAALVLTLAASPRAAQTPAALRIVVIAGEDAVNVVQQKTAVAPVVEVRDRNGQPVAGVVVNFAVRSGQATFNGARTLAVTTNAAGRAVAAGLTPTGSGALQISASAAFQGQTATVAIAQTNVLTAAQAAAASSAGGGSGATAAGAGSGAGTGGGLSATTIGVVGGAAAGGTIMATQLLAGPDYLGKVAGDLVMPFPGCARTESQTGTLGMNIANANGAISGDATIEGEGTVTTNTCGFTGPGGIGSSDRIGADIPAVTGSPDAIAFTFSRSQSFDNSSGSGTNAYAYAFTGALSGSIIAGALTITRTMTPTGQGPVVGTIVHAVTLQKR